MESASESETHTQSGGQGARGQTPLLLSPQSHFLPFRPAGDNEQRGDGGTAASPGQGVWEDLEPPPTMHKPAHQRRPKEQAPHATAQTPAQPPQPLSGAEAKGHKSSIQSGAFFAESTVVQTLTLSSLFPVCYGATSSLNQSASLPISQQ